MNKRNVVVAMPFGGADAERRRAILNFSRLKYIVENHCDVAAIEPDTTGTRIGYEMTVARTFIDRIPKVALQKINNADILIALMAERNFTVTYELGYRRALGRAVILIGDSRDDLPIYEAEVNYSSWKQEDVLAEIDRIVDSEWPRLADFNADIPDTLKQVIDAEDDKLIKELQSAFEEVDKFVPPPSDPVQRLLGMLSDSTIRFYPSSVVEVSFSNCAEFENPNNPTKVIDFDDEFSRLYGYVSKSAAEKDTPLTLERLLNRIERFSDADDWNEFLEEQVKLTETVIKDFGFARATVPIKINSSHTHSEFKCKSFLPCIAAHVTDGDRDEPHRMYLLVVYIEMPNWAAHLSMRGEG